MRPTDGQDAVTVYDSGRVPLVIRAPCLAIGLLSLAIACDLVAHQVFGRTILFEGPITTPWGWVPALLGCLFLSYFMFAVWFGRKRILWDPSLRELVIEEQNLFWKMRHRIPRDAIAFVGVRRVQYKGTSWKLYAVDPAGRRRWLMGAHNEDKATAAARAIAEAVGVGVRAV